MMKKSKATTGTAKPGAVVSYGSFDSPIGTIRVASDGKNVVALGLGSESERDFRNRLSSLTSRPVLRSDKAVKPIVAELRQYFEGQRKSFTFSADLSDLTSFQRKVLKAAARIPYGQTRTYAWLARQAKSPRAFRAAGQVMARNPVPLIIPCHRVIGSSGDLCGFGGGTKALSLKRKLLAMEGIIV